MPIVNSALIGFEEFEQQRFREGTMHIHRIFPFERFVDLVRNQWLALVRPSCWEDPFENPLNRMITDALTGRKLRLPHFESKLFAQCWSFAFESDAMWRIYSTDRRGVLVTASAQALLTLGKPQFEGPMEQVFLGKVQYKSQAELKEMLESQDFLRNVLRAPMYSHDSSSVLLYKRDSFKHEEEVRLILSRHISEVPGDIARFQIPLDEVILKVTLDPRLNDEEFERYSYLMDKIGYKGRIECSSLYSVPHLNLEIPSLEWLYKNPA